MNALEKILFHQSSPIMRAIGYLLLCYPVGIFSIFYLSSLRSNSSFLQGLLFLWQESPGFYVYIGGFLGLSLLMLGTKLKITSQAIYYTLAGFRISLFSRLFLRAVYSVSTSIPKRSSKGTSFMDGSSFWTRNASAIGVICISISLSSVLWLVMICYLHNVWRRV